MFGMGALVYLWSGLGHSSASRQNLVAFFFWRISRNANVVFISVTNRYLYRQQMSPCVPQLHFDVFCQKSYLFNLIRVSLNRRF